MKKYLHVANVGIQNTLVYRVNFLFRAVMGLVPLTATIFLWKAVFEGKQSGTDVAGYSLGQMISYYLIVTVVNALTAVTEDDWQIAADIRDGNISQFIVKPIDYMTYRIVLFGAGRLMYSIVAFVPVVLFIFLQKQYFVLPVHGLTWLAFGLSLFLTALMQFFISYTMALLAFWVLEVSTFIFILFAIEYMAGGQLFPVDILPHAVATIINLTPFPYLMFFPVNVYLERISEAAVWQGIGIQFLWTVATFLLARWAWNRGIKHYSAVGG